MMSIDKIGSANTVLHSDVRAPVKRQQEVPEQAKSIPVSKTVVVKGVVKVQDPPFFPIGDTQSIFDK